MIKNDAIRIRIIRILTIPLPGKGSDRLPRIFEKIRREDIRIIQAGCHQSFQATTEIDILLREFFETVG